MSGAMASQWKGLVCLFLEMPHFMGNGGGGGGTGTLAAAGLDPWLGDWWVEVEGVDAWWVGEAWEEVGEGWGAAGESSGPTSGADSFLLDLGTGFWSDGSLSAAPAEEGAGEIWSSGSPGGSRSPPDPPVGSRSETVLSGSSASSSMLIFLKVCWPTKACSPIDFLFHSEHSLSMAWTQASRSRSTAPGPLAGRRNLRGTEGNIHWRRNDTVERLKPRRHSSLTGTCFCG